MTTMRAAVFQQKGKIGLRLEQVGMLWRVVAITPAGAAAKAGVQVGDDIVAINGLLMPSTDQLRQIVAGLRPGEVVTLKLFDLRGPAKVYRLEATAE